MKTISELKSGDIIWFNDSNQVRHCKYLCIHPTLGEEHILMDECQDPFRMHEKRLNEILGYGYNTYKDARIGLSEELYKRAEYQRRKANEDFYYK